MKKYTAFLIWVCLWSCSPQSEKSWSPELKKVVLQDVCFSGDQIKLKNNKFAVVLSRSGDSVQYRIPGNEIEYALTSDLQKLNSFFFFRGSEPGIPLKWAMLAEPGKPRYQDDLGISYEYTLGENNSFRVDYYTRPQDLKRLIKAIQVDISFAAEADAIRFYRELSEWFTVKSGSPVGQLGDFTWNVPEKGLILRMELSGRKKNISLAISPAEVKLPG